MPEEAEFHLALVPTEEDLELEAGPTLLEKRKIAARAVWAAHERKCVVLKLKRRAHGGGLREPSDEDLRDILGCASRIRMQEKMDDGPAFRLLRDAALSATQAASDARADGHRDGAKLVRWRQVRPFRPSKLGNMLADFEEVYLAREGDMADKRAETLKEQLARAKARELGEG